MKVVIIDYGAGNVQSVANALNRLGVASVLSNEAQEIKSADRVIFPGVGHAAHAMRELKAQRLDVLIPQLTQPVLGICLGMQLMCTHSEEGNTECLGIFNTNVLRFENSLKVPHIGWNTAFNAQGESNYFYFVHSYYVPANEHTTLTCDYGIAFSAAMQRNNFTAVQFHPEKSSVAGERLLGDFLGGI